jgi:long-subunit acyl-CoA synthetase (AMP-forming)
MISGGAPLLPEVKQFLTVVFSAPIFEAYGLTEAAGSVAATAFWERKGGHVGGILSCLRM